MLLGQLVFHCTWYAPIPEPTLTDDQIAAGSYYTWDESAYQADNTKQGWILTHKQ